MTRTQDIESALRSLDAACTADRTQGDPRASSDLERILAAEPHPGAHPQAQPRPRRIAVAGPRRLAVAACLVAATTVGLTLLPSAVGGGDQAFASWVRAPEDLSASERAEAVASCRDQHQDAGAMVELGAVRPAVAERRGTWTTVVLAGERGSSALCITDGSAGVFAEDMIGSVGRRPGAEVLGPRDVLATDLGTGTMRAGDISLAAGATGAEVTGITYRSPVHGEVVATVDRERFALWMPGAELEGRARTGVPVGVTYRDGTTRAAVLRL